MAKNIETDNPSASMGLDEIKSGITASGKDESTDNQQDGTSAGRKEAKSLKNGNKKFEENLAKYTGISEQGFAIWLPKEVKKKLEYIRLNAQRNIPLRSLAAAIIMTYIEENEADLNEL